MSAKPILAVDKDDVVGGFNRVFVPFMNGRLGTSVVYEDCHSFSFEVVYGRSLEEMAGHLEHFCHHHHHTIPPEEGATTVLPLLAERFDLHLVTSRCESLADITRGWLRENGIDVFVGHHFANSHSELFAHNRRKKSAICREIGAVALLEDALHNAEDVTTAGIPVLMPNRPWNRSATPAGVHRFDHWNEVPTLLSRLGH